MSYRSLKRVISQLYKQFINKLNFKQTMKKKHFFTFACVMALMSGFVSCTNEDFEDVYTQDLQQKTRAARNGMTKEDVLARLDEIGEKYGVNVNMLYVRDYAEFTESTFEKIEQKIIADIYEIII